MQEWIERRTQEDVRNNPSLEKSVGDSQEVIWRNNEIERIRREEESRRQSQNGY